MLQGTAFDWYHYEVSDATRLACNYSLSIYPWCQQIIKRFETSHFDLITELEATNYTRKDATNRKDATAYVQDVLRITKGLQWPQESGLMTAFHHFEAGLQRDLDPPNQGNNLTNQDQLTNFIKQVQLRQKA